MANAHLPDPSQVRVLPPGSEAVAAVRAIWPAEVPPLNIGFATEPYTLATLVKDPTVALMNLDEIDMPEAERADAIASALRDFAHLVLGLPEDSRGTAAVSQTKRSGVGWQMMLPHIGKIDARAAVAMADAISVSHTKPIHRHKPMRHRPPEIADRAAVREPSVPAPLLSPAGATEGARSDEARRRQQWMRVMRSAAAPL